MDASRNLQIANIIGLILVLTMNSLAVALPLGGRTTGELSDLYPNLFVPAGYAFSIWSVIYVLLIIFVFKQAKGLLSSAVSPPPYVERIGWWFFISCLANASWILAWHYLLVPVSVVIMLLILLSLIQIYQRLGIQYPDDSLPLLVRLPFSIYLGWISVATIANVTTLLVYWEWSGWGLSPVIWTIIMIGIATLVGALVFWRKRDLPFVGVLIWALTAIAVKRQDLANPPESSLIYMVYLMIGLLAVLVLYRGLYQWYSGK